MTSNPKERAFPWRCLACGKRTVAPATIDYTARIKHDGRLHEVPISRLRVPRCKACGELVFGNDTEDRIYAALRQQLGLLQPEDVRAGRERLKLSQRELGERLGVAAESISRWETGAMIQTRAVDNLLRLYYALPAVRDTLEAKDPHLGRGRRGQGVLAGNPAVR